MTKATDELIKTHRVVEKVLEGFVAGQPRFSETVKTLRRTVGAHAWLQDEILLPALKGQPLIGKRFLDEIVQEHKDLGSILKDLAEIPSDQKNQIEANVLQIQTLLKTHFQKETEAFYPLVEKVIDVSTLNRLRDEMERRETEVREVIKH